MRTAPAQISSAARRRGRRAGATGLAIAVLMGFSACTGDAEEPEVKPSTSTSAAPEPVVTDAALGSVRGALSAARATAVVADVTEVLDTWSTRAFEGAYPRTDFTDAFTLFTPGARKLALARTSLLSNAAVGADLTAARVAKRAVRVDVLAAKGKAAGATARIRIVVDLTGATARREVVTGRLLLTPTANGWRVFGFDVRRGEGA